MTTTPSSPGAPIIDKRQLVEYLESGCKPPEAWRVGTEHEKFVIRRSDLRRIPYDGPDGIAAVLREMIRFGWKPVTENGNTIALSNDARCSITLEPGGQFELSGAPLETVHQTCDEVHEHLRQVREVCDELTVCTDDGSYGRQALVTQPMQEILSSRDDVSRVWAIGPAIMMKFCARTTEPFGTPTIVSLNSIMVDGTGMCGACRVMVGGQTKFVCVDGPEFDGHEVDWDLLMARQRIYLDEEKRADEHFYEHFYLTTISCKVIFLD